MTHSLLIMKKFKFTGSHAGELLKGSVKVPGIAESKIAEYFRNFCITAYKTSLNGIYSQSVNLIIN